MPPKHTPPRTDLHRITPRDPWQRVLYQSVEGPYKRTRPMTLTWRTRLLRWVRRMLDRGGRA